MRFSHNFTKSIPQEIEDGILYISVEYGTAIHNCACGCGNQVVTPFSPAKWRMTYDGENISLYPSIGNWGFACKSHYWIKNSEVVWANRWDEKQIERGRNQDEKENAKYHKKKNGSWFSSFLDD